MTVPHEIIEDLIKLSHIFKSGFTILINDDYSFNQVSEKTGYVISYKTLITIDTNKNTVKMSNCDNDIIGFGGGWLDTDTGIYYIEKNYILQDKKTALILARTLNKKAIFDLSKNKCIDVPDGLNF